MNEIIKVRNFNKKYQRQKVEFEILKDINFSCYEGEICVLLGASGSGKTTLMNAISGLDTISSGEVIVNNINISNLNDKELTNFRKKHIGFIFQQYDLIPDLTLKDNILLSSDLVGKNKNIDKVIEQVNLTSFANSYPHQLSGGMQQRVAIARAIIKEPKILFCDEPTGALDEESGKNILKILKELNSKNTTIFMITHNPNIAKMANQIIHIKDGKIDKIIKNENLIDPEDINWG